MMFLYAVIAVIIILVAVCAWSYFRKDKFDVADDHARGEPSLDESTLTLTDRQGYEHNFADAAGDDALVGQISFAGEQAVAASYGEPYQSELQFNTTTSESWEQVVKNSLEQRIGKTRANIKRRTTSSNKMRAADEFLVLYLMAPRSRKFVSENVVSSLQQRGLALNKHLVFESLDGDKPAFYVASLANSGQFKLGESNGQQIPGINFIIDLPKVSSPKKAFRHMLKIADELAQELGGEVLDYQRQRMTHGSMGEYLARVESLELARKRTSG